MGGEWLIPQGQHSSRARTEIVAIPHAGGAPSSFRGLAERLGDGLDLWIAQLPGRERRFTERPVDDFDVIVNSLAEEIDARVSLPFVLLGHSMGALLALEVARELRRSRRRLPCKLILAVSRTPEAEALNRARRHQLADDELSEWLRGLGSLPEGLADDREFFEQLLTVTRADLRAVETHEFRADAPLPCPIAGLAGARDPEVSRADVAAWKSYTSGDFTLREVPGGHFPATLIDTYAECVRAELDNCSGTEPVAGEEDAGCAASDQTLRDVTDIWRDVLGLSDIGPEEDFFDAGGYSLAATTVVARCSDRFGITVPVYLMFDHPVLADFTKKVEELLTGKNVEATARSSWPVAAGVDSNSIDALLSEFEQRSAISGGSAGGAE